MIQRIMDGFINPEQRYGPIPFWALNDDLKPERLRFCLRELAQKGCAGVIMHARTGLEIDYLAEEWWESIKVIVDECNNLGLKAWIYDDYNWPSGSAGGKVLDAHREFLMPCLKSARVSGNDVKGFLGPNNRVVAAFTETTKGIRRIGPEEVNGVKRELLLFYEDLVTDHTFGTTCAPWLSGVSGYLDIMNPEAVDAFMELTHHEYASRFKEYLGSTITGLFTDEPQFYRGFPWTYRLPEVFREFKGYDLVDNLYLLETDTEGYYRVRYDYYQVVEQLYAESYFKKVRQWCDEHNLVLTGHLGKEEMLTQLPLNHGGIYHLLKHMSMPGIDALGDGNPVTGGLVNMESPDFAPRAAASIARSHSDGRVLCEAGGGSGWSATLHSLKYQLDWLFASGVNFINPHHSLVSIKGLRKRDFPPFHFTPEPWFHYYKVFSDYISRVSFLLSQGDPAQDFLLLVPTASMRATQKGRGYRSKENRKIIDTFNAAMDLLIRNQMDFELLFEETVEEGLVSVSESRLNSAGSLFDLLVVPACVVLTPAVEELLERYLRKGGKVIWVGVLPSLSTAGRELSRGFYEQMKNAGEEGRAVIISNIKKEGRKMAAALRNLHPPDVMVEDPPDEEIIYHHRRIDHLDIYFLANMGTKRKEVTVSFHSYRAALSRWNPVTAECSSLSWERGRDGRVKTRMEFEEGESCFLVWHEGKSFGEESEAGMSSGANLSLPPLDFTPEWKLEPEKKNIMLVEPWEVKMSKTEPPSLKDLARERYFTGQTRAVVKLGRIVAKGINLLFSPEKKYRTERFFDFGQTEKMQEPASLLTGMKLSRLGLYETTGAMNRLNDYLGLRTFMRTFPPPGVDYEARSIVQVNYVPDDLLLVYEDLGEKVEFMINGISLSNQHEPVEAWDPACRAYRVSGYIKRGRNSITMKSRQIDYRAEVPSTHSIEPVALQGSFGVNNNTMVKPDRHALRGGDWSKRGYPYYSGIMVYRGKVNVPENYLKERLYLDLGQVRECARVLVNGKEAATRIVPPFIYPVSELLKAGDNEVKIEVANTGANFFDSPRQSGLPDTIKLVSGYMNKRKGL